MRDQPSSALARTAIALVAIAGLLLRVRVIASPLRAMDSDEAVVALIGARVFRGDIDVMYWGQAYGGTIESLIAAPFMAILGPSVLLVRVLLVALSATAAVLTWRLGRALVGPVAGLVAAALWWTSSPYFVHYLAKANIYCGALCCALAATVLLLRARAPEASAPWWWAPATGVAAGAALWSNPQTVALVAPVALACVPSLWRRVRYLPAMGVGFLVGASPWIAYGATHRWATLHVPSVDAHAAYPDRVRGFFGSLPIVAGLRLPYSGEWVVTPGAWRVVALLVSLGVVAAVVRRTKGALLVACLLAGSVLLFAVAPQTAPAGTQPRYLLMTTPLLAIAAAVAICQVRWRDVPVLAPVVVACSALLAFHGLGGMERRRVTLLPLASDASLPADIGDLLDILDEEDVRYAYADYWVAYRTTFERDEQTVVTPVHHEVARFAKYDEAVRASPSPAFILLAGRQLAAGEAAMTAAGVPYRVVGRGAFGLVLPEHNPGPDVLRDAYRV